MSNTAIKYGLQETLKSKDFIGNLSPSDINERVLRHASDIDTVASVLGIDPNYLSVQVRLMIPYYTRKEIFDSEGPQVNFIREILRKLRLSLERFEVNYLSFRKANGSDLLKNLFEESRKEFKTIQKGNDFYITNGIREINIRFGEVDEFTGISIQNNLHYIHKYRKDTKFHFGLFLEGYNKPICYCAFSVCDREYQARALSLATNSDIIPEDIYVMTRAFTFSPAPKNLMSKLFERSIKFIQQNNREATNKTPSYIITALNPFLGFNGSVFLGSNFKVFATSPMKYKYSTEGLYLNRRSKANDIVNQSLSTPPIVWLATHITKSARKRLENMRFIYNINEAEYDKK